MKNMIAGMVVLAALAGSAKAAEVANPTEAAAKTSSAGAATFRLGVFRCQGATTLRAEGGESSCKTEAEWSSIADAACAGSCRIIIIKVFFFNNSATTEIYTKHPCSEK